MPRGYRLAIIALGLTLLAFSAHSQEAEEPTLESEPVAETEQTDAPASADQGPKDYSELIERIASELVGIKGAIRDLETEENAADRTKEEERKERDLNAQEDMAFWAKWMLWATVITVFVGIGGVVYVRWALLETRRLGQAEIRAYPSVASVRIEGITNGLPNIVVAVKNSGSSPALRMTCRGRLMLTYQEDALLEGALPDGAVVQRGMEISTISLPIVHIPPNSAGEVSVYANHTDEIGRDAAMRAMASNVPRSNPFWMVSIFFDWVDVFDAKHSFYINAGQRPGNWRRGWASEISAMDELVLTDPFEISFQSESRKMEGVD